MIVAKCPACSSNKNKVKYGKFLECLDCGVHFYGVFEPYVEPAEEPVEEELPEEAPVVAAEETSETELAKPKRQVGKPAVRGKGK